MPGNDMSAGSGSDVGRVGGSEGGVVVEVVDGCGKGNMEGMVGVEDVDIMGRCKAEMSDKA